LILNPLYNSQSVGIRSAGIRSAKGCSLLRIFVAIITIVVIIIIIII